jgi:hypothetical protein
MKFEYWIKNASEELGKAVSTDSHNSDIWKSSLHKSQMLPYYIQYKMLMSNRRLVYATWGLAIATIILTGISLFL